MVLLRSFAEPGSDPNNGDPYGPPTTPVTFPTGVINPTTPATPVVPTAKGGGGGGPDLTGPSFPSFHFGAVPTFTPPKFTLPSFEEATNEPGYKFRAEAGLDALQHAQASRGLLRTGGSLKDLSNWSQNNAASEYQNVASRSLALQNANYQGAKDAYAPLLAQWSMLNNAELQKQLAIYGRGTVWGAPRGGGGSGFDTDPMPVRSDYHSL